METDKEVEISCLYFLVGFNIASKGDGLEAPLSFKMMQWSCYCIWRKCLLLLGEGKFYGHVTAKDSEYVTI